MARVMMACLAGGCARPGPADDPLLHDAGLVGSTSGDAGAHALYGPRHLLQLVAIKRLQARGLSLAAVQERVIGHSDASLRRLAAAEAAAMKADVTPPSVASSSCAESFCASSRNRKRPDDGRTPGRARRSFGGRVGAVIDGGTETTEDDLRVIRMAAAPLIEILRLRGLTAIGLSQPKKDMRMTTTGSRTLPLLDESTLPLPRGLGDEDDAGFGVLLTARGRLPLTALDVVGRIDGLLSQVKVRQTFVNATGEPLEATYIFPLPDRAAVTDFRMEVAGRVVEGVLKERGQARRDYSQAVQHGHRASIAEEERPGVFSLRVGNLMPGDVATVELMLVGVLPYCDGEITFRFPLVVAPRYMPGVPLSGPSVGGGTPSIPTTFPTPRGSRHRSYSPTFPIRCSCR